MKYNEHLKSLPTCDVVRRERLQIWSFASVHIHNVCMNAKNQSKAMQKNVIIGVAMMQKNICLGPTEWFK